jgi:hypothetical protein
LRGANTVTLGTYKPNRGQREAVVLNVHADVEQGGAHAKLNVGPPESWLDLSSDLPFVAIWAMLLGGFGVMLLLALAIVGTKRRKRPAVTA